MKLYVFVGLLVGVYGDEVLRYEDGLYKEAMLFVNECGSRSLSLCFKEKALKYIERLPSDLDVGGGIKIRPNDVERASRQTAPVSLPDDFTAREDTLDRVLLERISDYLNSHTLEFKMPTTTLQDIKQSVEEGRKKKGGGGGKNKGGMMPLMLLLQLKVATLGAIALKVIGLVAFKALLVAKVALTIASIIALKKLVEQKHHTSTYEVLAHPHYEDLSHYDRSFTQELAYKAHKNNS